jgi:aromatic ring hydroxylase
VSDSILSIEQKRDHYLQIMGKAQKLNDQILVKLILKKLARTSMTRAVSTENGCMIIPFPTIEYTNSIHTYERISYWTLAKLTIAIPGSLVALLLLTYFRFVPGYTL